jgi:hypothetical protein
MKPKDAKFQSYLRQEVESAGKSYETAVEKVFALTSPPDFQTGPDLAGAMHEVVKSLRLYSAALKSLANFATRELEKQAIQQPETVESSDEHILVHA